MQMNLSSCIILVPHLQLGFPLLSEAQNLEIDRHAIHSTSKGLAQQWDMGRGCTGGSHTTVNTVTKNITELIHNVHTTLPYYNMVLAILNVYSEIKEQCYNHAAVCALMYI